MSAVEVKVETTFDIDLDGNAHIVDKKTVMNRTKTEQRLQGPFKQGIRQEFENVVVTDSDGNKLNYRPTPDSETSGIHLFFAPHTGEFVIPPESTKWFTVEYDATRYAEKIGSGLLLSVHSGNIKYETDKFNHFEFAHLYQFNLRKRRAFFRRVFNKYAVRMVGFKGRVDRRNGKIQVRTSGVLKKREVQTNIVLLEAQWRKGLSLVLAGVAGAAIKYGVSELLALLAKQ